MKSPKSFKARQAAEGLFPGLQRANAASSNTVNPFDKVFAEPVEVAHVDGTQIIVSLPAGIELVPGYASDVAMREAMTRAWGIEWLKVNRDEAEIKLPVGWSVNRSASETIEVRDGAGVIRAICGYAQEAELRLLPRYRLESQDDAGAGQCRLVVRDRENNNSVLKSSFWAAERGSNHPSWNELAMWLDKAFPHHRDPLQYWEDCEQHRVESRDAQ
jgi:hypothetical protein